MNLHVQARLLAGALAACALALGACGSSSGSGSSGSGGSAATSSSAGGGYGGGASTKTSAAGAGSSGKLALKASESGGLSFDQKALSAKAGSVTLTLDNPSGNGLPHAIAVEGNGLDKAGQTAQPGSTSSLTVDLKPGTYTFYCPVGNHRAQGMEGKLTVG
jgi:plastocyanin